jgi:hypothetical protein
LSAAVVAREKKGRRVAPGGLPYNLHRRKLRSPPQWLDSLDFVFCRAAQEQNGIQ